MLELGSNSSMLLQIALSRCWDCQGEKIIQPRTTRNSTKECRDYVQYKEKFWSIMQKEEKWQGIEV